MTLSLGCLTHRIQIFRIITGSALILALAAAPNSRGWANQCQQLSMTKDMIRSEKVELTPFPGEGAPTESATLNSLEASALTYKDCGDPEFFLTSYGGADYLVKKSLFKCRVFAAVKGPNSGTASSPGSGAANTACPTKN